MGRTVRRPLPSGEVSAAEGWALGLLLTVSGLVWAAAIDLRYASVVLVGVLLDVGIYTMLLKRRTPYAVLIGGLSGGMPALAGRVLAVGEVDGIGLLLALGVLLWIPTHIMTFNIKYQADYARARVPTFPSVYGIPATRQVIAVSTLLTVSTFFAVGRLMSLPAGLLASLGGLGLLLILLVVWGAIWPGPRLTFVLYKGASIYMLASMLVLIAGGW
jgi:protoheme IX farnesyltransferase